MSHEKQEDMSHLFSRQDMKLLNVRFFRGSNDVISDDEFRQELRAAAQRKRSGEIEKVSSAPRCKQAPIDVRAFVAQM